MYPICSRHDDLRVASSQTARDMAHQGPGLGPGPIRPPTQKMLPVGSKGRDHLPRCGACKRQNQMKILYSTKAYSCSTSQSPNRACRTSRITTDLQKISFSVENSRFGGLTLWCYTMLCSSTASTSKSPGIPQPSVDNPGSMGQSQPACPLVKREEESHFIAKTDVVGIQSHVLTSPIQAICPYMINRPTEINPPQSRFLFHESTNQ